MIIYHYSLEPLRGYQGEDIEIVLPKNLTVYDIEWLSVWCVQYKHNFGHVLIPKDLDVPPALGQTKITVNRDNSFYDRWKQEVPKIQYIKPFTKMLPKRRSNFHRTPDHYRAFQFFSPFIQEIDSANLRFIVFSRK